MRMDGRRESRNVEDRRGKGGSAAGLGIGGVAIVAIITLLMGGNITDVFRNVQSAGGVSAQTTSYEPTAENEALAKFSRQIKKSYLIYTKDYRPTNEIDYVPFYMTQFL